MNPELASSLERIMAKAKKVPDQTAICRCGSQWKNGREEPIGWVFISDQGRGLVRRCEVCNSAKPIAPGSRAKDLVE